MIVKGLQFQRCYRGVTGCNIGFTGVLPGCYRGITGCYHGVKGVLQGY